MFKFAPAALLLLISACATAQSSPNFAQIEANIMNFEVSANEACPLTALHVRDQMKIANQAIEKNNGPLLNLVTNAIPALTLLCSDEKASLEGHDKIAVLSGLGTSNTQPFKTSGPWQVRWDATDDIFQLYLYSSQGEMLDVIANQGIGKGSSYYPVPGTYFLKVNTSKPWAAIVISDK